MKRLKECIPIIMLITTVLLTGFSSRAYAMMRFEGSASEDGFLLAYTVPGVGRDVVALENPGDTGLITIAYLGTELAKVELTLNEITSDPEAVNLHVAMTSEFFGMFEIDLPVPFGAFGADINFMGRRYMPTGNHDIDVSALLTKNRVKYEAHIDLPPVIADTKWSGTATPADNVIHETIENSNDDSVLLELTLELFAPPQAELEISDNIFMTVNYDIVSNIPYFTSVEGTAPVPYGSYHIWYDPENPIKLPDM